MKKPTLWRVCFGQRSSLLVTAETREEARLQAVSWTWLATGRWLLPESVEIVA